MTTELWRDIPGYEGIYMVSNFGRVKSLDRHVQHRFCGTQFVRGRLMATPIDRKGYPRLVLCVAGAFKSWAVHRALMAAFMPRSDWQSMHVNHKDGVTTNNHISNLEWCTASENRLHSYRVLGRIPGGTGKFGALHHNARPLVGRCIATGEERTYASTQGVCVDGFKPGDCTACASGRQKSHRGWLWRYAGEPQQGDWKYAPTKRAGATHHAARPVERVSTDGSIKRYGAAILARSDGFNPVAISHVLHGRSRSHRGYFWRYAIDDASRGGSVYAVVR